MSPRCLPGPVTALLLLVLAAAPARAREPGAPATPGPGDPDAWLAALQDRVAADLRAGRPLVVHAHVALCDNSIIRCGGHGLGDGDRPATNLYWATAGGTRGWLDRRGSGWTRVAAGRPARAGILVRAVWRRRVVPGAAWRRRGVARPFDVYLVADAWRGRAIDAAVAAYLDDLYRGQPRPVSVAGAAPLAAGGAAHLVAYVGHNRWMDTPDFDWTRFAGSTPGPPKGTLAIACHTRAYLGRHLPAAARVPLLLTADFLFASSPALEGAVLSFAAGGGYAAIRAAATRAYAVGQRRPVARVAGVFTNPADRRWGGR
jgi:hypothetical protein